MVNQLDNYKVNKRANPRASNYYDKPDYFFKSISEIALCAIDNHPYPESKEN
jgi:hypothetical protein